MGFARVPPIRRLRAICGVALLLASTTTARAQERPQTMPSRDVEIVYTITRGGQVLQEKTSWFAAEQQQRIDTAGVGVHFIMDRRRHRAWMVNDALRTVVEIAAPRTGPLDPGSTAAFTKRGSTSIAGQTCIDWATAGAGTETVLCLTGDGVLLRVQAGGRTLVEANSVTYEPADPKLFAVPTDYTHGSPPG